MNLMKQQLKETSTGAMVVIGSAVIVLIFILLVASMVVFGFGWFSQKTANFRGETAKREVIEANGALRAAAYDHFFDLCARVQATEASVTNLLDEREVTTDPQRLTIIAATITALRNNRAETITGYNADSRKSYTIGQFKASDLPFKLDINDKETTCTA